MKTILFVDNLSFCRELFSLALTRAGYQVATAADGLQALETLRAKPIHLIIMDANLPNMDGLTALRIIRNSPEFKKIPVFILTTVEDRSVILQASQIGIQAYILKSQFALETMLVRIEKQIGAPATPVISTTTHKAKIEVMEIEGEMAGDFV